MSLPASSFARVISSLSDDNTSFRVEMTKLERERTRTTTQSGQSRAQRGDDGVSWFHTRGYIAHQKHATMRMDCCRGWYVRFADGRVRWRVLWQRRHLLQRQIALPRVLQYETRVHPWRYVSTLESDSETGTHVYTHARTHRRALACVFVYIYVCVHRRTYSACRILP